MKRYWPTFVMAGVLAGLGGYLYWIELPEKRSAESSEVQAKQLLSFAEQDITGLTVRTLSGEVTLGREAASSWKVTAPIQTDADRRQVQALLRALIVGKVSRVVEAKQHPNADKLRVCQVDTGKGILEVVCGAPNARTGMKAVFAPVGAIIPASGLISGAGSKAMR